MRPRSLSDRGPRAMSFIVGIQMPTGKARVSWASRCPEEIRQSSCERSGYVSSSSLPLDALTERKDLAVRTAVCAMSLFFAPYHLLRTPTRYHLPRARSE